MQLPHFGRYDAGHRHCRTDSSQFTTTIMGVVRCPSRVGEDETDYYDWHLPALYGDDETPY